MQFYSTDSNERQSILWTLALISIGAATFIATHVTDTQILGFSLKGLAGIASSGTVFGILYGLFNTVLWKWEFPFRTLGLVKIPNLNGTWSGTYKTSFDQFHTERPYEILINQTWTKMAITMNGHSSSSESTSVYMTVENNRRICLTYSFRNDPREDSIQHITMSSHKGLTTIEFDLLKNQATGNYFTNRTIQEGRGTQGTFLLRPEHCASNVQPAPQTQPLINP